MRASNSLQILLTLLLIMMAGLTTGFAVASNMPVDTSAQPFTHPSDDVSYDRDYHQDEMMNNAATNNNDNVQYITGGIADSGMQAMDMATNAYDLKLLFVQGGEFLANVDVNIADSKGNNVLTATTDGPVLLAKMPAGKYTLMAKSDEGEMVKRTIRISDNRLSSYVLRYPPHQ